MSGRVIVVMLLSESAALTALVPVERIAAGVARQGTALPAIAVTAVGGADRQTLSGQAVVKVSARVQITVMADTMTQLEQVMKQVRHACRDRIGTLAGFAGATCRLDGEGPDFSDPEAQFCIQTQDTRVTFNEDT